MKKKKGFIYILLILVSIYILVGLIFFGANKENSKPGTHLENNEGQELGLQMSDVENEAKENVLNIEKQKKEGNLDENALLEQVEASRKYLVDNLNAVDLNNDCYMELLYHSSFLNLLGEEYKISNNDLIKLANEAHTYIVNVMNNEYDENRAVELKRELQKVTEEDSLKVVEKIIGA
ncbi:MAG: hypothetical protein ACI4DX_03065 [Oliverpabstia sp.]|nr:hypothetical protein [Eubacterium sp.]MDY2594207.1 hypothetical protein [Oliverpabstia sp.]